jgi:5-hydroxyisourate hydrolase
VSRSPITSHVLDLAAGRPAEDVELVLFRRDGEGWVELGRERTNSDGRALQLLPDGDRLEAGEYRLRFELSAYFIACQVEAFYPRADIDFLVRDTDQHYHVPLLLSPFGYSTYRGS